MNKFGNCFQWRIELLSQKVVFLYRQGRNERSARVRNIGNCAMMPVVLLRPVRINHFFPIPSARWIFMVRWHLGSLLPIAARGGAESLKGSQTQRMGNGRIFLKTSAPHSLMTAYEKWNYFQPDPSRWTVPLRGVLQNGEHKNKIFCSFEVFHEGLRKKFIT